MNEIKLDLRKKLVLDLKKELNITDEKAQVVLALDYSGSMSHLYSNGSIQELLERLLPIALQFDDNGAIDFLLFHTGYFKGKEIRLNNINSVLQDSIRGESMGGTHYKAFIDNIISEYKPSKPLFGSAKPLDIPVYVIVITDGDTSGHRDVKDSIIEASKYGIFFQFVGIGHDRFSFLEDLDTMSGRNIDNAGFFKVPDLSKVSDKDLYKLLLTEFPSFIKEARTKGMIK